MKEIKNIYKDFDYMWAIIYDKRKNEYSTLSAVGGKIDYQITSDPIIISQYQYKNITMTISTYDEFVAKIQPATERLIYFKDLPQAISNYIELLHIKPFKLQIEYILIPSKYGILHETKKSSANNNIKLTFIDSITDEQIDNIANYIEKYHMNAISHELFHFLSAYSKFPRMKELREETFASLFGGCVAYNVNPEIIEDVDVLTFPKTFFLDAKTDVMVVRKFFKKKHYNASRIGGIMAHYYFQAVASNYEGGVFSSDEISDFCHKLFSEHNFKHPIEKKPPPWFKEFLQGN